MLTNEELDDLRRRGAQPTRDMVHMSRGMLSTLVDEIDRLRRRDALAREWLKMRDFSLRIDVANEHHSARTQAAIECNNAREAYRRAVEGEGQ